ncbi:MAG: RNA polymerase sigma factor [Marinilabiliaceae bacterium]|nr:RNA polymerase sigma factor [Marinilabiliaceae bacterium]
MAQPTDEEIMIQVKNGDLDALSILFTRYKTYLYNFYLRMGMDESNALDFTQQVFYRILKYRQSYMEGNKFKTWIFKIARNVMNKELEKRHWQPMELNEAMAYATDDSSIEKEEAYRLLHHCINKLSGIDREVIALHRFQGMKYDEVASITGLTVAAIKVRAHRAMEKLRKYYFELA